MHQTLELLSLWKPIDTSPTRNPVDASPCDPLAATARMPEPRDSEGCGARRLHPEDGRKRQQCAANGSSLRTSLEPSASTHQPTLNPNPKPLKPLPAPPHRLRLDTQTHSSRRRHRRKTGSSSCKHSVAGGSLRREEEGTLLNPKP